MQRANCQLSQYVDHLVKPLLKHIPAYVQDTTDFLRRMCSHDSNLPNNFILLTYINIPNDQGIQAYMYYYYYSQYLHTGILIQYKITAINRGPVVCSIRQSYINIYTS